MTSWTLVAVTLASGIVGSGVGWLIAAAVLEPRRRRRWEQERREHAVAMRRLAVDYPVETPAARAARFQSLNEMAGRLGAERARFVDGYPDRPA